jgi:hypothetical protein
MSDSLGDLLAGRRPEEPAEVQVIKQFMLDNYQAAAGVAVRDGQIIIQVASSALAGTLRMRLHELKELCATNKRLIIRVG